MDLVCLTLYDKLSGGAWLYTVGHEYRNNNPILIVYVKRRITGLENIVPAEWRGYPVEIKMVPGIPATPVGGFRQCH